MPARAQDNLGKESDTLRLIQKEFDSSYAKKGWSIAPVPFPGYSSDFGWIFGLYTTIWNFGDGSIYPNYYHQFETLFRYCTNRSGIGRVFYDSEYLIPHLRTSMDLTFMIDKRFEFFGFNGYESPYIASKPDLFYRYSRNMFRFTLDVQGGILKNLKWAGGFSFYHYSIGGAEDSEDGSLYIYYITKGLISANEKGGGENFSFKAGLFYDTRDFEKAPKRGIATEALLIGTPDPFTQGKYSYLQLSIIHRQFIPLFNERVILACRIGYQGILAGNSPFYTLQNLNTLYLDKTYSDGLGGEVSIRGILSKRVVGNGMVWFNLEPRILLVNFTAFKQRFSFLLNPFFDCGMVVQPFKNDLLKSAGSVDGYNLYSGDKETLHTSAGIGAKMSINENFILTMELGFALDKRDGNYGLYFGTNYLF